MLILPDDILFNIAESQKNDPNVLSDELVSSKKDKPKASVKANVIKKSLAFKKYNLIYYKRFYRFILNKYFDQFDKINQLLLPALPQQLQENYIEIIHAEEYDEELFDINKEDVENTFFGIIKKIWNFIKLFFNIKKWYKRIKWVFRVFKKWYSKRKVVKTALISGGTSITKGIIDGKELPEDANLPFFERLKLRINMFIEKYGKNLWIGIKDFLSTWFDLPINDAEDLVITYNKAGGEGVKKWVENKVNSYKEIVEPYIGYNLPSISFPTNNKKTSISNFIKKEEPGSLLLKSRSNSIFNNNTIIKQQNVLAIKPDKTKSVSTFDKIKNTVLHPIETYKQSDLKNAVDEFIEKGKNGLKIFLNFYEIYKLTRNWLKDIDTFRINVINSYKKVLTITDSITDFYNRHLTLDEESLLKIANIKIGKDLDRSLKDSKKDKTKIKPRPDFNATGKINKINDYVLDRLSKSKSTGNILLFTAFGRHHSTDIKDINGEKTEKKGNIPQLKTGVTFWKKEDKFENISDLLESSNEELIDKHYKEQNGFTLFTRQKTKKKSIDYNPADISVYDGYKLFEFDNAIKESKYDKLTQEKIKQMHIKNKLLYEFLNRAVWIKDSIPVF